MFDWISHNKELFLQSHTEIGVSYQHALDLQTQHNHFAMNSMVSGKPAVSTALGAGECGGKGPGGSVKRGRNRLPTGVRMRNSECTDPLAFRLPG